MKLIIIAAGRGSRLRSITDGAPKSLSKIHGYTIIDVLIHNCKLNNIRDVVIVTGYDNDSIRNYLKDKWNDINIEFIYNEQWHLENGLSVLKAKDIIPKNQEFMISMSDHLYFSELLKKVINSDLSKYLVNVGVDLKIDSIFDLDDGMKLEFSKSDNSITAMSKKLTNYNAIDVGLFKCNYKFFNYLTKANKKNNCSLSKACNELILDGYLGGVDISNSYWLDIDTPEALDFARNDLDLKLKFKS
jgi:CDP-L-myo-inositol myo-inositolphosphotransferase